jgi:hypothetical protein
MRLPKENESIHSYVETTTELSDSTPAVMMPVTLDNLSASPNFMAMSSSDQITDCIRKLALPANAVSENSQRRN